MDIKIENISKHFINKHGHKIFLLNDISFNIKADKVTSILAPKGSGKSELLKILAGLSSSDDNLFNPSYSSIFIPSKPSSFPWMSVQENILYELDESKKAKLDEVIDLVGLEGYEDHKPDNNSIGFRFRISLAKALIRKPDLILLDEPFNKLADNHKVEVYQMLSDVIHSTSQTILLATTNLTEAVMLSSSVVLMKSDPGEVVNTVELDLDNTDIAKLLQSDDLTTKRIELKDLFKTQNKSKLISYTI